MNRRNRVPESGKASKWTWETYRWHPKNGRIDPKNIKGTGIAFDERDRATLPKELRKEFEAWMDELADPKGEWTLDDGRRVTPRSALVPKDWRTDTEYSRDYDYVRAFLAAHEDPELAKVMVAPVDHGEEGYWLHMNDVGKLPTHPVFSTDSYYARDPKYAPLAGSWEGETYIPGKAESEVHEDAKGGDTGPAKDESIPEPGGRGSVNLPPQQPAGGGPRIVINPSTFRNEKDALCVAFNEAFRLVMEEMGFNPVAEPTEAQRRFFSDTAYRDDELQLRRTILARICTFDTSVKDPTDEQLQEAVEFLEGVMEAGAPQNEWEQSAVQRLHDVIAKVPVQGGRRPEPPEGSPANAAGGAGDTPDELKTRQQTADAKAAEDLKQAQENRGDLPTSPNGMSAAQEAQAQADAARAEIGNGVEAANSEKSVDQILAESYRASAEAKAAVGELHDAQKEMRSQAVSTLQKLSGVSDAAGKKLYDAGDRTDAEVARSISVDALSDAYDLKEYADKAPFRTLRDSGISLSSASDINDDIAVARKKAQVVLDQEKENGETALIDRAYGSAKPGETGPQEIWKGRYVFAQPGRQTEALRSAIGIGDVRPESKIYADGGFRGETTIGGGRTRSSQSQRETRPQYGTGAGSVFRSGGTGGYTDIMGVHHDSRPTTIGGSRQTTLGRQVTLGRQTVIGGAPTTLGEQVTLAKRMSKRRRWL